MSSIESHKLKDEDYNSVLEKSKSAIKHCFLLGIVYAFFHTSRVSIYFLYANEFNPTSTQLYLLLYGFPFWNGIALLYASLCNQYGYDIILVILTVFQCIGVLLESIASNFWMLFAGVMIAQIALNPIILGYIAWMLPFKQAKEYTSYYYAGFAVSYLFGPVSSGFTAYYLSYRAVFLTNLVIVAVTAIYTLFVIRNTQKHIETLQLAVNIVRDKDDNEQFPVCLPQHKERTLKWYQMPRLSVTHTILLLSAICIHLSFDLCEFCLILYFAPYVIDNLSGTVYEGALLVTVMSFAFIIGNVLVPPVFERVGINNNMKIILYVCIGSLLFLVLITYLYTIFQLMLFFWFNTFLLGLSSGIMQMSSEMLTLMVQPTQYSGKVNGAKGLLLNWIQALSALCVAIWWNVDHNGLFYVIIIGWVFGVMSSLVMLIVNNCWKQSTFVESEQISESARLLNPAM